MGRIWHHAIVVSSYMEDLIRRAHLKAESLGCNCTDVTREGVNGWASFLVAPDGSKEGWPDSDEGDARRDSFISWLDAQRYEDGSTSLYWVEVSFGETCQGERVAVERHAWGKREEKK
jgi:hypothetical protein